MGGTMRAMIFAVFALFLALPAFAQDLPIRPDPTLTPGATNPAVTQANIHQTICVSGWTKTIRPPASYTNKLKAQQMIEYRYPPGTPPRSVEEDHLISLELGGSPTDPENLWPEPWAGEWGARRKDVIETKLKHLVCSGAISLEAAQTAIRTDWIAAYHTYVEAK